MAAEASFNQMGRLGRAPRRASAGGEIGEFTRLGDKPGHDGIEFRALGPNRRRGAGVRHRGAIGSSRKERGNHLEGVAGFPRLGSKRAQVAVPSWRSSKMSRM